MNENELTEYQKLAEKSETESLTNEELTRLNQLHVIFLGICYDSALKNAEEQKEIKDSLSLINQTLDERELLNTLLSMFIEDKGLADEFNEFLNLMIEYGIEIETTQNSLH